jgi:hypothetical protein
MEKLQAKGELAEEELRALEMDVTGKVRVSTLEESTTESTTDHVGLVARSKTGGRSGPARGY